MRKLNLVGITALLFTLIAAFAFKTNIDKDRSKFACTLFVYNGGGPNDPTKYSQAPAGFNPSTTCLGTDDICAICTTHIINGMPAVNQTPLSAEIASALTVPRVNHRTFTGGDEIWLKAN